MKKRIRKSKIDKASFQKDSTKIEQTDKRQLLRLEILKTFHQPESLKDLCERAVSLIKEYLDCDVVALRLKKDEDYPYFVNNGFSKEFIESENYLCMHDEKGNILRDSHGRPLLAWTCGLIINAKFDSNKIFFTKEGSFWTNSTTDLLASTTAKDRGTVTRNVCNQYGYESVALVPIKSTEHNIGLLQINDKRRNLFTLGNIELFEELGHIIGTAIERDRAEGEIKNLAKFPSENPYPVFRVAKDGIVLYANTASLSLLGEWRCRVGQSVPDKWHKLVTDVLASNSRRNIEVEHKGQIFTFAFIPVSDAGYVNIYGFDITERKKAEAALKYSEERYVLAQRAANIGSWDWDIRTGNLEWSEKIEPMFGFAHGQFRRTYEAFLECVHPEDRQYVVNSVNACIEKGRDYDIEHRILWSDGTVRWVSETGNVIRDKDNKAIRMLGVVRDITARKQAEEVLKRDKETFEKLVNERTQELLKIQVELDKTKRLSDIGTLAATVAHELRNPLGVIQTAAYNIKRKIQNPLINKHLANIGKKISESDQIINNLLSYSRIKIPNYEKVRIYDILNDCIEYTRRGFYKLKVSIVKDFGSIKNKIIEADSFQSREIFCNILTNAYQSIPDKKGKIRIKARFNKEGYIEISFNDNGEGIAKEDLKKVFDPFFTRKSKGTGLGLTICNELVHLHNGKISIESEKGKGTTVTVILPIKRQTQ